MWMNLVLMVGLAGFLGYVPGLPGELRLLNLLLLVPLLRGLFAGRRAKEAAAAEALPPRDDLPLPPAAGGTTWVTLRYLASSVLCLVVPTMLVQIIRQLRGQGRATPRAIERPQDYAQRVRYRLPFAGSWYIVNGGSSPQSSHSWDVIAQRFAYDFVVADEELRRWRTDGKALTDYLCYGLPILAPADGEVVGVVEGVRDAPGVGSGWIDVFTRHFPGNMVVIRHAPDEYSMLAHLVPGSITVQVGEPVRAGQPIGRCGNSGHSSEPHLHFHVQDHADFFEAAGLPIVFDGVRVHDAAPADGVDLLRGMRVAPAE